jgi:hypothetical protein
LSPDHGFGSGTGTINTGYLKEYDFVILCSVIKCKTKQKSFSVGAYGFYLFHKVKMIWIGKIFDNVV